MKGIEKMKRISDASPRLGILIVILGLILAIIGISIDISEEKFQEKALSTTAVITDLNIHTYRKKGKTKRDYDIYVEYEIDGKNYRSELNVYDTSMKEGQRIEILYDPKNPGKAHIYTDGGKWIVVIMGGIPIIIGIVVIVISIKKHKKFKALINNGMCATGTIVNFRVDTSATLNKEHPYIAEVEVTDAITGEKRRYDSEWVNSSDQSMKGSSVAVYIDKSYYYIDLKNKIANNNYR